MSYIILSYCISVKVQAGLLTCMKLCYIKSTDCEFQRGSQKMVLFLFLPKWRNENKSVSVVGGGGRERRAVDSLTLSRVRLTSES